MRILDLAQGLLKPEESFVDSILYGTKRFKGELPKILSFYPAAYNNPFQSLLYRNCEEHGFVTLPCHRLSDLGPINWGDRSYLHFHWLKNILEKAKTKKEALKSVHDFEKFLVEKKAMGHKILWTVHNVLPHEVRFKEEEIQIRKLICQEAHLIHSLSKSTEEACSRYYSIPREKIITTFHPSYEEIYPKFFDKDRYRYELNFDADWIYLFFGALTPYKNLEFLLKSLKEFNPEGSKERLFVIAGKPSSDDYCNSLKKLASACSARIVFHNKQISSEKVSWYFEACDAVILPYFETLNSGVVTLSRSFSKPLIAPRKGPASEIYGQDYSFFYDNNSEESFLKTLLKFESSSVEEKKIFKNENNTAAEVSEDFFKKLRDYLR